MKRTFFAIAISAITLTACSNNKSEKTDKANTDSVQSTSSVNAAATVTGNENKSASMNGIFSSYLQMKNALTNDNGKDAATAGNTMAAAFKNVDESSLTSDKKKAFEDIKDDAGEHAEHIGMSGDNIKHQREHFDMLSKDIYDLVKAFGAGQSLYYDHCPMYNNNKGANWISETKEIKNPYLGAKMPTCGSVKEELK